MDRECIICEIINNTKKSFIVYEDDFFLAFLDNKPLFKGHCLLSPKKHYPTLYDLPDSYSTEWLGLIKKLGNAIMLAMKSEGSFIAINNRVSQSIDHLHVHIVPRNKGDGLKGFFWPRQKYENEADMQEVQGLIKNAMQTFQLNQNNKE